MDHVSELSVHTSSSWGNEFGNTKQERDNPSGVMLWYSPELMASDSWHLWLFTRQKIKPRIFTGTSSVTGWYTTRRQDIWTGMDGWRQQVYSVEPLEIARSTPRYSSLISMPTNLIIGKHILYDPTTYPHLYSIQETPPMTSQMINGPTWSWIDITAYQKWNGIDRMEPPNLLLSTWIMFLWRCGISFNRNQPLSLLTTLKKWISCPLPHLITTPTPNHV